MEPGDEVSHLAEALSTCPRCGRPLTCGIQQGNKTCWCMELPLLPKEVVARWGQGCLCRDCLLELAGRDGGE